MNQDTPRISFRPVMRRRTGQRLSRRMFIGCPSALREPYVEVLLRDPCPYCGLFKPRMNREHVEPKVVGGPSSKETNVVGACCCCNTSKSDTPLLLYLLQSTEQEATAEGVFV